MTQRARRHGAGARAGNRQVHPRPGALCESGGSGQCPFQERRNNISASLALGINDDVALPYNPPGWFQTNPNEAFNMNQSLAIASGVQVIWIIV